MERDNLLDLLQQYIAKDAQGKLIKTGHLCHSSPIVGGGVDSVSNTDLPMG